MKSLFPEAKAARPAILEAMKTGGSAHVEVGGETRLLMHSPALDQALTKLPWPLSLLQPHQVTFATYQGETCITEKKFQRGEINAAIDQFLSGVPPTDNVLVTIEN